MTRSSTPDDFKPCRFVFDNCDEAFEGFATGRTWNGFDVVAVNRAQFEKVMGEDDGDGAREERALAEEDFAAGRLYVLEGKTTTIVP